MNSLTSSLVLYQQSIQWNFCRIKNKPLKNLITLVTLPVSLSKNETFFSAHFKKETNSEAASPNYMDCKWFFRFSYWLGGISIPSTILVRYQTLQLCPINKPYIDQRYKNSRMKKCRWWWVKGVRISPTLGSFRQQRKYWCRRTYLRNVSFSKEHPNRLLSIEREAFNEKMYSDCVIIEIFLEG